LLFCGLSIRTAASPHQTVLGDIQIITHWLACVSQVHLPTQPILFCYFHPCAPYPHTVAITLNYKRSACSFCGLSFRTAVLPHQAALAIVHTFLMNLLFSWKRTRPLSQYFHLSLPPQPEFDYERTACSRGVYTLVRLPTPHQAAVLVVQSFLMDSLVSWKCTSHSANCATSTRSPPTLTT
jgi:hypothetical protein